jgi:glycosyltransferase involved in cell wall biosynthesis
MTSVIATVGIPMYNAENTIGLCLKSILESNYDLNKLEIVIVDNFSKDNSIKVAGSLLSSSNIDYRILQCKGSIGLVRQIIVNEARGKYIIWVDADAVISRDFIGKQLKFINNLRNKGTRLGVVLPIILPYNTESLLARGFGYKWAIPTIRALLKSRTPFLGMLGALTPIEIIRKVGGFNIKLAAGEDVDLFYRMKKQGYEIFVNPEAKIYHVMPTKLRQVSSRAYKLSYYYHYHFPPNFHRLAMSSTISLITTTIHMLYCLRIFRDVSCLTLPLITYIEEVSKMCGAFRAIKR